ncbi:MAG TPA: hypothetical protein V6C95_08550 [Coleofasciculaceae cyanobacterium]
MSAIRDNCYSLSLSRPTDGTFAHLDDWTDAQGGGGDYPLLKPLICKVTYIND